MTANERAAGLVVRVCAEMESRLKKTATEAERKAHEAQWRAVELMGLDAIEHGAAPWLVAAALMAGKVEDGYHAGRIGRAFVGLGLAQYKVKRSRVFRAEERADAAAGWKIESDPLDEDLEAEARRRLDA